MSQPIIYIKAEQATYLNHPDVHIGDVCSIYSTREELAGKIKEIQIYEFDKTEEGRVFISILVLIREIERMVRCGEVRSVGEQDMVIYYKPANQKEKNWRMRLRILFLCLTCFFGTGISIMGYNNDVDMAKVFGQLYLTFTGTKAEGPTFIELFYSIGLTIGIFLFFHHIPGKKVTNEPTPIQVQMRLYEQDVNQTFIIGASRKGEEIDVGDD